MKHPIDDWWQEPPANDDRPRAGAPEIVAWIVLALAVLAGGVALGWGILG